MKESESEHSNRRSGMSCLFNLIFKCGSLYIINNMWSAEFTVCNFYPAQQIGLASLGLSDEWIDKLAAVSLTW